QEFNTIVAAAIANADAMQPYEFELEIMRATALAHNGHTYTRTTRIIHPLPIRLWWFADGLHVVSTQPDFSGLLGARVEQLGKFTPAQALAAVAPFLSGTEQRIRYLSAFHLPSPEVLHHIGATETPDSAPLTLRLRDGTMVERTLGRANALDPSVAQPDAPY